MTMKKGVKDTLSIRVVVDRDMDIEITKAAKKLKMSKSGLCNNLLRASLDDLAMYDLLKITDAVGFLRGIKDNDEYRLEPAGERR